jgi:hypothetical protein
LYKTTLKEFEVARCLLLVESVNLRPLRQQVYPLPNALIAALSLESAPFALFYSQPMSEVVFAGRRSIAVNAATRISVNGLIRLFARETRFLVFIRTQIQMVVANASYCIEWMDISSVSVVERR